MRLSNSPAAIALLLAAAALLIACETEKSNWTDAQLQLTSQQAQGRRLYNQYCSGCHAAYTTKKLSGPPMKDLYKKQAMPSGAPPTDERISSVVMRGRRTMPGFGNELTPDDLQALLAYLRTL